MAEIKICGLTRRQDARDAEASGAVFGGAILVPGSRRSVAPVTFRVIFGGSALRRCGVFVDETYDVVVRQAEELRLDVLQLHGNESPVLSARLRVATGRQVWKALRPRTGAEFVTQLERFAGSVDGLLLDGWSAAAPGGTGTPFPWEEVAAHRSELPARTLLIVAGGLTPDNVTTVVTLLQPDVVDVSSGVEQAPGIKDAIKIRRFAEAVRLATEEIRRGGDTPLRHSGEGRIPFD